MNTTKVMIIQATYTSVWDDGDVVCTSPCTYDTSIRIVSDIEIADNYEEADNADSLTDEYVTLPDGTELREADDVEFQY